MRHKDITGLPPTELTDAVEQARRFTNHQYATTLWDTAKRIIQQENLWPKIPLPKKVEVVIFWYGHENEECATLSYRRQRLGDEEIMFHDETDERTTTINRDFGYKTGRTNLRDILRRHIQTLTIDGKDYTLIQEKR